MAGPTKVGATSLFSNSTATAMPASYSQTPTAGNLLLMGISATRASTAPDYTLPSGWNAITSPAAVANGANQLNAFGLWRVADGTAADNAPTIAGHWATTSQGLCEEWSGLASVSPWEVDAVGDSHSGSSGTLAPSWTTTNATDFLWMIFAARSSSGGTYTPDGSFTASQSPNYAAPTNISSYYRTTSSAGTFNPSFGYSSALMAACAGAAFKLPSSGAGVVPQSMMFAA